MAFSPDLVHKALAGVAALFFVAWLVQTFRLLRARRSAAALVKEARQRIWEYRVEHLGLVWYPSVTASPEAKTVTAVKAGVPHCRKCAKPLKLEGEEWICAGCGDKRPESVADLAVIDAVSKQAAALFMERRPDFKQVP